MNTCDTGSSGQTRGDTLIKSNQQQQLKLINRQTRRHQYVEVVDDKVSFSLMTGIFNIIAFADKYYIIMNRDSMKIQLKKSVFILEKQSNKCEKRAAL